MNRKTWILKGNLLRIRALTKRYNRCLPLFSTQQVKEVLILLEVGMFGGRGRHENEWLQTARQEGKKREEEDREDSLVLAEGIRDVWPASSILLYCILLFLLLLVLLLLILLLILLLLVFQHETKREGRGRERKFNYRNLLVRKGKDEERRRRSCCLEGNSLLYLPIWGRQTDQGMIGIRNKMREKKPVFLLQLQHQHQTSKRTTRSCEDGIKRWSWRDWNLWFCSSGGKIVKVFFPLTTHHLVMNLLPKRKTGM